MSKYVHHGLVLCFILVLTLSGCGSGGADPNTKSWVVSGFTDYTGTGWAMAFDSSNNLYVTEYSSNRIIKITAEGVQSIFADQFDYFNVPRGIIVDDADIIYYCNDFAHYIVKVTQAEAYSIYAGIKDNSGSSNTGSGTFNRPFGLALNRSGKILYVADRDNAKIRKIDMNGGVTVSDFASLTTAPNAVAVDSAGYVYACAGNKISKYTAAGAYDNGYTLADNPITPVLYGMAVDGSGNMLAADWANHIIWMIDSDGHASVLAGTPGAPGSTNGPASSALFTNPYGIAIDSLGRIYVTEAIGGIRRIVYQ